jgi:hypothetical protein
MVLSKWTLAICSRTVIMFDRITRGSGYVLVAVVVGVAPGVGLTVGVLVT